MRKDVKMKTQQEYIEQGEQYILKTYNRFPVVLEKGKGVYLYDADQKKYLDFGAGIAVFALGYSNDAYKTAVKEQVDKLVHTSNLFYNEPAAKAAKKITQLTGMDRVFFTNSGTEAIEGAIKLVRKYAYNKDGRTDHEIIAMKHSFHGRSMGALAVTSNKNNQEAFGPMIPVIKFAQYIDLDSVKELVNDRMLCNEQCYDFNALRPSQTEEQTAMIKKIFGKVGSNCFITAPFWCDYGYNIEAGDNFYANHNLVILDCAKVTFGNNVFIAPDCGFYTAGHPVDAASRNEGWEYAYPINVGNDVWIGGGVKVMPGVTIGNNVVIGGGSVVVKDIPDNSIAVGNPCKVIKKIESGKARKYNIEEKHI